MVKRYVGIDPSTKTGVVILSEDGNVIKAEEITTEVEEEPQRFMDIANQLSNMLDYKDEVCIEGFSYNSRGKAISTQYGIGWITRVLLLLNDLKYTDIPPATLKKFASGKGNIKKDELAVEIFERWGFKHKSDNVRDAYVLAQIARALDGKMDIFKFQEEALKKVKV